MAEVETEIEKMERVKKEYYERTLKKHKTHHGGPDDRYIECPNPKCDGYRTIVWSGSKHFGYWQSCWKCGFKFPEDMTPPGPEELEEIFKEEDRKKRVKKILDEMRELGINI